MKPYPDPLADLAVFANGKVAAGGRFRGLTLDQLRDRPPPAWVVDPWLAGDSLAVLEGDGGVYKSFLALAWAHCMALGQDWLGHPVRQGRVLYLLGESSRGLPKRCDAWQICNLGHRVDVPDLLFVVDEMPQLWQGDASAVLADNPGPFGMVVVDTLARSMVGGNENLQVDMGKLIDGCDHLRSGYDGALVLLLHHLNSGGSTRGSTALPGAIATRLRLERQGNTTVVHLTNPKQRDGLNAEMLALVARKVELGTYDDQGREDTSVVLDADDSAEPVATGPTLTRNERQALDALLDVGRVRFMVWERASRLRHSTFARVVKRLEVEGLVTTEDLNYVPTELAQTFSTTSTKPVPWDQMELTQSSTNQYHTPIGVGLVVLGVNDDVDGPTEPAP